MQHSGFPSLASQESFERSLESAISKTYPLPDGRFLVSTSLSWQVYIDPYRLFDTFAGMWRFLWKSQNDTKIRLGLGKLLSLDSHELSEALAFRDEAWFFALPFEAKNTTVASELSSGYLILPEIEWLLEDDRCLHIKIRSIQDLPTSPLAIGDRVKAMIGSLSSFSRSAKPALERPYRISDQPTREIWQNMVANALDAIAKSKLEKVVLSRSKLLEFGQPLSFSPLLSELAGLSENSYFAVVRSPSGLGFVSRSPEKLLAWDAKRYHVDAIAGTRKREASRSADFSTASELRSSPKELNEHRFVSDYVKKALSEVSSDVVCEESESLLRLQHVQHMRSRFSAARSSVSDPFELLMSLHPTPAVAGLPKQAAIDFIAQLEASARGLYAGGIGCIENNQKAELALGIRSALIDGFTLRAFAGAGIVEGSSAEAEWQETEDKMLNFMRVFES